jgi:hypothetical protein
MTGLSERMVGVPTTSRHGVRVHPCAPPMNHPTCAAAGPAAVGVRAAGGWGQCVRQVAPVRQILAHGMAPHQAPVPLCAVRHMLVEQVVAASVEDESVGVVQPAVWRRNVEARAIDGRLCWQVRCLVQGKRHGRGRRQRRRRPQLRRRPVAGAGARRRSAGDLDCCGA